MNIFIVLLDGGDPRGVFETFAEAQQFTDEKIERSYRDHWEIQEWKLGSSIVVNIWSNDKGKGWKQAVRI